MFLPRQWHCVALFSLAVGCGDTSPSAPPPKVIDAGQEAATAPTTPATKATSAAAAPTAGRDAPVSDMPAGPTFPGLTAAVVCQVLVERGFTAGAPARNSAGLVVRRCEHASPERPVVVEVFGRGEEDVFKMEATWQHFHAQGLDVGARDLAVFLAGLPQSGETREQAQEWLRSAFFKNESYKIGRIAYATYEKRRVGTVLKIEAFR